MVALKILKERLIDLERISKMYQSTQVQVDILETKVAIDELEALQSRSCLSCSSCNKDMQLVSCPPQYTLSCEVFKTVFVNDFKQSCSRYCPKEQ